MISPRGSCWCAWPKTSQSQICPPACGVALAFLPVSPSPWMSTCFYVWCRRAKCFSSDILRFLRASLTAHERSQEVRTSLLILSIVQRFQSKMANPFRIHLDSDWDENLLVMMGHTYFIREPKRLLTHRRWQESVSTCSSLWIVVHIENRNS
jgi:hypothetical protein